MSVALANFAALRSSRFHESWSYRGKEDERKVVPVSDTSCVWSWDGEDA